MVLQNYTLPTGYNNMSDLKLSGNTYGLMNFKTKEMHCGDKINSSFYLGLCQVRSWSR
jgi:hypothetical protein